MTHANSKTVMLKAPVNVNVLISNYVNVCLSAHDKTCNHKFLIVCHQFIHNIKTSTPIVAILFFEEFTDLSSAK